MLDKLYNEPFLLGITIFIMSHMATIYWCMVSYIQLCPLYCGGTFSFFQTTMITLILRRTYAEHRNFKDLQTFYSFRKSFYSAMHLFFVINSYIGHVLAFLIAAFSPPIAFICVQIVLGRSQMSWVVIATYASVFFFEMLYAFLLHFQLAQIIPPITNPAKSLYKLSASITKYHQNQKREFKVRFHISKMICAFHNKNRYGFTYGAVGLITMEAFVKVYLHISS